MSISIAHIYVYDEWGVYNGVFEEIFEVPYNQYCLSPYI